MGYFCYRINVIAVCCCFTVGCGLHPRTGCVGYLHRCCSDDGRPSEYLILCRCAPLELAYFHFHEEVRNWEWVWYTMLTDEWHLVGGDQWWSDMTPWRWSWRPSSWHSGSKDVTQVHTVVLLIHILMNKHALSIDTLFLVASSTLLWPPYVIGGIIFLPCGFFLLLCSIFFSSPNLSGHRLDVYHTSTYGVAARI